MAAEITEGGPHSLRETLDIVLVAALRSVGHKVMSTKVRAVGEPKREKVFFYFDADSVDTDVARWYNGDLRVDPRDFLHAYEDLRTLIRNKMVPGQKQRRHGTPVRK